ncbi:MAG: response regulator, partial [Phycisphaerales bacterium]|nr:response regulator [Phycisphaerales bacterium]
LINDILDLSKIESGTVQLDVSELRIEDLQRSVDRSFRHVAESRHVEFEITGRPPLPKTMLTDVKRLQQIIKNLLSNAFKFTHQGAVRLVVQTVDGGWSAGHEELERAGQVLAFAVSDTGIGISADKQQIIFEAFQQADGSTSRKYGGTGLGLAISRELARLLGGEIRLVSEPGRGSTFTLYLPQSYSPARSVRLARAGNAGNAGNVGEGAADTALAAGMALAPASPAVDAADAVAESPAPNPADDDRSHVLPGDRVLLIVENDLPFARLLLEAARQCGFKALVANTGAHALAAARDVQPAAITLDIHLPDMSGWRVLQRLKSDPAMRHVPVCVVSTDDARQQALEGGAIGFLAKPLASIDPVQRTFAWLHELADRRTRRVLALLAPGALADAWKAALDIEIEVVQVDSAAAACTQLASGPFDAIVVDGHHADFGPEDVLEIAAA